MIKWLIAVLPVMALIGMNASLAAANPDWTRLQIAQKTAGSAGPVAVPGGNMVRPRAFPSNSGAGISDDRDLNRDEEYATAIQNCRSLPNSQRAACINETNRRFGQM